MSVLSVRTIDAATDQPTAARIHLTASDGKHYAPVDAYSRVSGAGDRVFHQTGAFRVDVPPGAVTVEAVKGFEYVPVEGDRAGGRRARSAQVDLELQRLTDLSAHGWYNGSTHVHMNYAGNLHNTLENLMMMSAAEDQDMVNEQVANKDNRILDHQYFVPGGKAHPLSTRDRDPHRGPGVPAAVLRPRVHVPAARSPDQPVHDRLRGHGDREPVSEQHRHVPQGEGAGRDGGLRARVRQPERGSIRRQRSAQRRSRRRQGLHRGRGVEDDGRRRMVERRHGRLPSVVRRPQQRAAGHGRGRRGLDQQHASIEARRLGAHLRLHRAIAVSTPTPGSRVCEGAARSSPRDRWSSSRSTDGCPARKRSCPPRAARPRSRSRVRSITPLERVTLIFNGEVVETIPLSADRKSAQFSKTLTVDAQRLVSPARRGECRTSAIRSTRRSPRHSPIRCG